MNAQDATRLIMAELATGSTSTDPLVEEVPFRSLVAIVTKVVAVLDDADAFDGMLAGVGRRTGQGDRPADHPTPLAPGELIEAGNDLADALGIPSGANLADFVSPTVARELVARWRNAEQAVAHGWLDIVDLGATIAAAELRSMWEAGQDVVIAAGELGAYIEGRYGSGSSVVVAGGMIAGAGGAGGGSGQTAAARRMLDNLATALAAWDRVERPVAVVAAPPDTPTGYTLTDVEADEVLAMLAEPLYARVPVAELSSVVRLADGAAPDDTTNPDRQAVNVVTAALATAITPSPYFTSTAPEPAREERFVVVERTDGQGIPSVAKAGHPLDLVAVDRDYLTVITKLARGHATSLATSLDVAGWPEEHREAVIAAELALSLGASIVHPAAHKSTVLVPAHLLADAAIMLTDDQAASPLGRPRTAELLLAYAQGATKRTDAGDALITYAVDTWGTIGTVRKIAAGITGPDVLPWLLAVIEELGYTDALRRNLFPDAMSDDPIEPGTPVILSLTPDGLTRFVHRLRYDLVEHVHQATSHVIGQAKTTAGTELAGVTIAVANLGVVPVIEHAIDVARAGGSDHDLITATVAAFDRLGLGGELADYLIAPPGMVAVSRTALGIVHDHAIDLLRDNSTAGAALAELRDALNRKAEPGTIPAVDLSTIEWAIGILDDREELSGPMGSLSSAGRQEVAAQLRKAIAGVTDGTAQHSYPQEGTTDGTAVGNDATVMALAGVILGRLHAYGLHASDRTARRLADDLLPFTNRRTVVVGPEVGVRLATSAGMLAAWADARLRSDAMPGSVDPAAEPYDAGTGIAAMAEVRAVLGELFAVGWRATAPAGDEVQPASRRTLRLHMPGHRIVPVEDVDLPPDADVAMRLIDLALPAGEDRVGRVDQWLTDERAGSSVTMVIE